MNVVFFFGDFSLNYIWFMRRFKNHRYYVYIVTNARKTVLYTGVTNNLTLRLVQHQRGALHGGTSFTARYKTYHLIYWEKHNYILNAIAREKQIKGWIRMKKEALIAQVNPEWRFLNKEIMELHRLAD